MGIVSGWFILLTVVTVIFYDLFSVRRYGWLILLVASIVFYVSFSPAGLLVLIPDALISWAAALRIQKLSNTQNEENYDVIQKAKQYGNGVTSLPYNEQIFIVNPDDETTTRQYIPRETLRRVSTPQAYQFGRLDSAYHEAFEKGIGIYGSAYTNTMMVELGETLHFAAGSDKNIKLTTKDDLEMFKGYMKMDKDTWLK